MLSVPKPTDTEDILEHLCLWTILGLYVVPVLCLRLVRLVFNRLDKLTRGFI